MKHVIFFSLLVLINLISTAQKNNSNQVVKKNPSNQPPLTGVSQGIKEVKIGDQVWMGTNLNVEKFRNGDEIPQMKTKEEWIKAGENKQPAWCYYDFNPGNGTKYGKLYNWFAVNDARGLAPKGWHVPNKYEFKLLVNFLGGMNEASSKLKNNTGWGSSKSGGEKELEYCPECQGARKVQNDNGRYVTCGRCGGEGLVIVKTAVKVINGNGVNSVKFNAVPSGIFVHGPTYTGFDRVGNYCEWWTSSITDSISVSSVFLDLDNNKSSMYSKINFLGGCSVRCLKGEQAAIFVVKEKDITEVTEVKIGEQIWMERNLDVSKFRNGDSIPEAKTMDDWKKAGENEQPAWCYYDFDPFEGSKYGKLYNWYAVNDIRGLAPNGWHVPSETEWRNLTKYLYFYTVEKMKSQIGWDYGNGTNGSGFSGLPGGRLVDYVFQNIGIAGYWWSSEETYRGEKYADLLELYSSRTNDEVDISSLIKNSGLSIRCMKN